MATAASFTKKQWEDALRQRGYDPKSFPKPRGGFIDDGHSSVDVQTETDNSSSTPRLALARSPRGQPRQQNLINSAITRYSSVSDELDECDASDAPSSRCERISSTTTGTTLFPCFLREDAPQAQHALHGALAMADAYRAGATDEEACVYAALRVAFACLPSIVNELLARPMQQIKTDLSSEYISSDDAAESGVHTGIMLSLFCARSLCAICDQKELAFEICPETTPTELFKYQSLVQKMYNATVQCTEFFKGLPHLEKIYALVYVAMQGLQSSHGTDLFDAAHCEIATVKPWSSARVHEHMTSACLGYVLHTIQHGTILMHHLSVPEPSENACSQTNLNVVSDLASLLAIHRISKLRKITEICINDPQSASYLVFVSQIVQAMSDLSFQNHYAKTGLDKEQLKKLEIFQGV